MCICECVTLLEYCFADASYFLFKGIPQPELKFYKDDEMLKLRKKDKKLRLSYDVTDDLYILEISNPTAADAGIYRIKATNKLGSAEAEVTVTVVHDVEPKVDEKSVTGKVSDLLSGEIPQLQTVEELCSTSTEELTEVKSTQSKELVVREVKEIVTETQIIKENSESKLKSEMEAKSENVEAPSKFEAEIGTKIVQVKPDAELKSVAEYNAEAIQTMIENELKSFTETVTETVQVKVDNELGSRSVSETNGEGRLESEAETKIKAKLEYITEVGIETVEAKREAKEKSKDVEVELNRPSEADVETLEVIGKTALMPENAVKAELVQTKHERGAKSVTEITTEAKDETETTETKLESSSNLLNETSIKTVETKTETHVSSETQTKTKTQGNFESEVKKETTTTEIEAGNKLNIRHDAETELKSGNEIVAKSDIKDFSTAKTEAQHVTKSNAEIATESEVESEAKKTEIIHGEYLEEEISGNLPVFTLKPEPVTVLVGEVIQLTWKLTDDFKVEIEWLKNGKKLKAKKDKRIRLGVDEKTGNNFLTITEANLKDVGQYELRVDNEFGRIVQMVFVNVISKPNGMPPMFEEYPKPQVVTEGESFEIACRVAGMS